MQGEADRRANKEVVDVGGGIGLERMPEYGLHAILSALRREAARRGDIEERLQGLKSDRASDRASRTDASSAAVAE